MSDPNYSAQPVGGYALDADDMGPYCRPDEVVCAVGRPHIVFKDDCIRAEDGKGWVCWSHAAGIK